MIIAILILILLAVCFPTAMAALIRGLFTFIFWAVCIGAIIAFLMAVVAI